MYHNVKDSSILSDCCDHITIILAHILLINSEIGVLVGPVFLNKRSLAKESLIDIHDGQTLLFYCVQLVEKVDTSLNKVSARSFWHVLLLSDFLTFESVLDV